MKERIWAPFFRFVDETAEHDDPEVSVEQHAVDISVPLVCNGDFDLFDGVSHAMSFDNVELDIRLGGDEGNFQQRDNANSTHGTLCAVVKVSFVLRARCGERAVTKTRFQLTSPSPRTAQNGKNCSRRLCRKKRRQP